MWGVRLPTPSWICGKTFLWIPLLTTIDGFSYYLEQIRSRAYGPKTMSLEFRWEKVLVLILFSFPSTSPPSSPSLSPSPSRPDNKSRREKKKKKKKKRHETKKKKKKKKKKKERKKKESRLTISFNIVLNVLKRNYGNDRPLHFLELAGGTHHHELSFWIMLSWVSRFLFRFHFHDKTW